MALRITRKGKLAVIPLIYRVPLSCVLQAYHDVCYTCAVCYKKLSAPILAEREGEIFCKSKMPDTFFM